ncbi:MAG: hypothetical protein ACLR3C_06020 [Eggerthella lenta]
MPEFLKKASCRGRRPLHLVPRRQIPRPNLIAKLLRERHVARFIVAPDGFGKTGLAMEYADTVFSFEHVVWLDGHSPCFLRDLDRGVIARTLLEGDPQPFLVVIDDVPLLDPERAELLSDELDLLLDRDCEVMVACMPSRDAFARHRDRIKLTAVDLLLTDEEVDLLRTPGERSSDPASTIAPACRVATFVWGSDEERAGFLSAVLGEELPADLLLPLFVMASLGRDVRGRGGVRRIRPRSGRAARRAVPLSRHRLPQRPVRGRAVRGRSPRRRVCAQAGRVGRSVVVLRCEHARRALGRCARDARRARTGLRFRTFAGVARPASVLAREVRGGVAPKPLASCRPARCTAPYRARRRGRALCSAPTRRFAARFWGIDKRPALPRARRCATGTRRPPCR